MSTIWETVTWNVARAGGFTSYILLTLAVAVGLALSTQLQSPSRWPRLLNSELHNFLTLLSSIFIIVHVLAVWIDPFTRFGWNEVFIPFVSTYRTVWMALGIVGLYLGIAIGISTWLRPHIGYKWWRRLHVLTLGIYALATLHGIGTGSDTQTWWAFAIYAVSIVLVGSLLWRRIVETKNKNKKKAHVAAAAQRAARPAQRSNASYPANPRTMNSAAANEIAPARTQAHYQRDAARVR
ncbi:MAG TPA: ferric reductase-like transmembrane domain-containing protein [Ktedonobacteraceae bacterium]|nr:ferric reductase-like transmembrane domain-containing protein [Ktedonobacteraceae bacterium]